MYGALANWRAYATARGNNAPSSASDADAEAALTRASDMVRLRYVANLLPGYDATLQPDGYDYPLVEEAAYIAASLELATPGFFSKAYTPAEQKVLTGVQSIRWTVTGDASKKYAAMPTSSLIDAMFEPYIFDRNVNSMALMSIGGPLCE